MGVKTTSVLILFSFVFIIKTHAQQNVVPTVGDVGIGTIPTEKLDVNGNIKIRGDLKVQDTLKINSLSGINTRALLVDPSGNLIAQPIYPDSLISAQLIENPGIKLCDYPIMATLIGDNALSICDNKRLFGFGTATPREKFHIANGNLLVDGKIMSSLFANQGEKLIATNNDGVLIPFDFSHFLTSADNFWLVNGNNIYNTNSANVGIGTNTPNYKLEVNGNIGLNNILGRGVNNVLLIQSNTNQLTGAGIELYNNNSTTRPNSIFFVSGKEPSNNLNTKGFVFVNYDGTSYPYAMVINRNGNVGIGVDSPTKLLELKRGETSNNQPNIMLQLTNSWNSNGKNEPALRFDNGDGAENWTIGASVAGSNTFYKLYRNNDVLFRVANNGNFSFGDVPTSTSWQSFLFKPKTGNATFFEISAPSTAPAGWQTQLRFTDKNGGLRHVLIDNSESGKKNLELRVNDGVTGGNFLIFGDVGIGATCVPNGYKLAVDGNIKAKKIKVEVTNWCDYVFEPDYCLTPLTEVEKFIKTNKHLPEIPSTKEVTENGIELSEMNALLLKKIEELTLYVIEQDKRIKELEKNK